MKPVQPVVPGKEYDEVIFGKSEKEYENLPAVEVGDGIILSRWELTEEEKRFVTENGYIFVWMWTFGRPVMPLQITAEPIENPSPDEKGAAA